MLLIFIVNTHGFLLSKTKKNIRITNGFQKILDEFYCKPNKIWVDKGSEFYNKSMQPWLQDNDIKCIQYIIKENLLLLKHLLES